MSSAPAYSSVLLKYLKIYQDDPTSRIFAPLAEAYRKAGLVEQAIEICHEGLVHHPDFIGGKVALARALFDQKKFQKVIEVLDSVVTAAPDNLVAGRLFAESHLALANVDRALAAYKILLYLSPYDKEVAEIVRELETQLYESGGLLRSSQNLLQTPPKFQVMVSHQESSQKQRLHRLFRAQELLERVQKRTQS